MPALNWWATALLGLLGIAASIALVYVATGMSDPHCQRWMILAAAVVGVAGLLAIAEVL